MASLHQFATTESRGPAYFITCKYCKSPLREHFDHTKGHGVLGYSGHKKDCDALQAGLTVDIELQDQEDRAACYKAASKKAQTMFDVMDDAAQKARNSGEIMVYLTFLNLANDAIGYKPRVREHI